MDLMSSFKRRSYPSRYTDQRSRELSRSSQRRFGFSTMTLTKISASCLIVLSVMILLSLIFHRDPSDHLVGFADARILDGRDRLNVSLPTVDQIPTPLTYLKVTDLLPVAQHSLAVKMDNNDISRFVLDPEMQLQLLGVAFAVVGVAYAVVARHYERRLLRNRTFVRHETRLQYLDSIIGQTDIECVNQLRMDRRSFGRLCELLRGRGGLKTDGTVLVEEQVCMFLHILAHHVKVRTIHNRFLRSSETISRYFNSVLKALIRLHEILLQPPQPILDDCTDERWKCFKNCLGALDGTYIPIHVPASDKPRYRTRKGEIATNVLGVCSPDMMFIFVLPGWEGSASDSRILRDALSRPTGLRVPVGYYYLVDAGYTNCEGFLAPYRGTRYHLSEWRGGYLPQNHEEYFNKKHASARNVIERCFGLLKKRWAILRSPSFYPIRTHTRIITACCLLHNFIRKQMSTDPLENEVDDLGSDNADVNDDLVSQVGSTEEWTSWRDNLATEMYNTWNRNRSN